MYKKYYYLSNLLAIRYNIKVDHWAILLLPMHAKSLKNQYIYCSFTIMQIVCINKDENINLRGTN